MRSQSDVYDALHNALEGEIALRPAADREIAAGAEGSSTQAHQALRDEVLRLCRLVVEGAEG